MLSSIRRIAFNPTFNPREAVKQRCEYLNDYMCKNGLDSCTIPVGGCVSTAVVYGIASIAAQQHGSPIKDIVGITQPVRGQASIWRRALDLEPVFGGKVCELNLSERIALCKTSYSIRPTRPAFVRLSNQLGDGDRTGIVRGPCKDDCGYMDYYCRAGAGAGAGVVDMNLLAHLYTGDVMAIAREIGVPASILQAPECDNMWSTSTIEGMFGIPYEFVKLYSEYLELSEGDRAKFIAELDPASLAMFTDLSAKADAIYSYNGHTESGSKNLTIIPVLDLTSL